jgi:hypothetical protein
MSVLGFLGVGVLVGPGKVWEAQGTFERIVSVGLAAGMVLSCGYLVLTMRTWSVG